MSPSPMPVQEGVDVPPSESREWGEAIVVSSSTMPKTRFVDRSDSSSGYPVTGQTLLDLRKRAHVIGKFPKVALALLAYVGDAKSLPVDRLIEQGPRDRLFEMVFDLYDVGLLNREGAVVSVSPAGEELLRRVHLSHA